MDVSFILSRLGPSQFKLLSSLIWIISRLLRDLPDSAFAPVWSSLHTADWVIFWRQAGECLLLQLFRDSHRLQ